ncbi:MAG: hypothetical protein N2512_12790, partial [Armatimonadetes bacterium]|nr:hypothetical protein [Armatimonadota bacterium]
MPLVPFFLALVGHGLECEDQVRQGAVEYADKTVQRPCKGANDHALDFQLAGQLGHSLGAGGIQNSSFYDASLCLLYTS